MKLLSIFLALFLVSSLSATLNQQIFTDRDSGSEIRKFETAPTNVQDHTFTFNSSDSRLGLNWQTTDPTAVANKVEVSSETQNSFVGWILNSERVSLFNDTQFPVWEHLTGNIDFNLPIDMLEDGSVMAIGDEQTLKFFHPVSSTPLWEHTLNYPIVDLKLDPEGTGVYLAYYDAAISRANVEYFELFNTEPAWNVSFPGTCQTLDISGDGSTLILTQYGEYDNMFVLDSADGNLIFQGPEKNQNSPAISYDASIIVNGDYDGYIYVYEFDEELGTYEVSWSFSAGGDSWITSMAISADGSTIAIGTLVFLPTTYDGMIYLFNRDSPTPEWVYENAGDEVTDLDISDDGSLIAAAAYGPLDHSTPDFFLLRRISNVPVFEINTTGSFFSVDIAADGSFCSVSGKAVHAREMGNGGMVYNIDCDLGGGSVTGAVNLEGTDDNSGVRVSIHELIDYFDITDPDGNFTIENVPSEIYSVDYHKIGYMANSSTNVIVFDGETTELGIIEMLSVGSAPYGLTATQAADVNVLLTWDPVDDLEGYNIYRKRYAVDPYPDEPYASVDSDASSFTDDNALPLIEYYYVITAVLTGGLQSPYSNEVNGWISSGFVVDGIDVYEGSTPVIDGIISEGEWDDAFRLDTSDFWGTYDNTINPIGSVLGYYKINTTMTELYVAYINYNDTVLEDHDEVALYIDDNNDGVYSPEAEANEGNYWAAYYAAGNELKFRPIYDTGGVGSVFYLPDPQLEVSVEEGYLVYEFMIPIGEESWKINPSTENQSSLAVFVLDDNAPDPHGFDGWWPLDNTNLFNPEGFGTITYDAVLETPPAPENFTFTVNDNILSLNWSLRSHL